MQYAAAMNTFASGHTTTQAFFCISCTWAPLLTQQRCGSDQNTAANVTKTHST
jgi:hypothetical protein